MKPLSPKCSKPWIHKKIMPKVISEGLEVSNSEYHSVFIIPIMVTLTCVYSYGKHVCDL